MQQAAAFLMTGSPEINNRGYKERTKDAGRIKLKFDLN